MHSKRSITSKRDGGRDPWLARYLASIERYPRLDRELELELARRHRAGDSAASELLVGAHLRDVVVIARRYLGYGHALAELIGEGNLGLVIALDRFEPDRGLRFMTYAGYWVRAEILEFVMSSWSVVGVGKSSLATRLFFGLAREQARLSAHGYDTSDLREALAASFGCSPERIDRMRQRLGGRDLDDASADQSGELSWALEDPESELLAAEREQRSRHELDSALAALDQRERTVIEQRVLAEQRPSLVEIGRQLGISRERVRQLEVRARAKLARDLAQLEAERRR
ncbi:MAG: sigma-70 family RNA polymerase sigma factor [Enhygromyxa sp.]